ncbi:DUF3833 domain-containing protein [Vibrio stylophorae]|nr:DUF3833 domain-containing protein [Vibrio stylophorae]
MALMLLLMSGCSADIEEYETTHPSFDLFEYFQGEVHAWGMVQDYRYQQTRRFEVVILGYVDDGVLVLEEDFVFDDGDIDRRVWRIEQIDAHQYQGEADDILGMATGVSYGNALQWQYSMNIEVDDSSYEIHFDDWLYRQDERHLFNLTKMTKFGVEVGRITLFFQKIE